MDDPTDATDTTGIPSVPGDPGDITDAPGDPGAIADDAAPAGHLGDPFIDPPSPAVTDAAQWMPPAPIPAPAPVPVRRRRRGPLAAAFAGILAVGLVVGAGVGRLTSSSPSGSTAATSSSGGSSPSGGSSNGSGGSTDTSSIAAKVAPGVVDINVTESGGGTAAGTGVVITSSGEVLTNNHVIADETSITVQIATTGATYKAHVLGYDVSADLALLQLEGGSNLSTVQIGSSSNLSVGEAVVTLGNALGRSGTPSVTSGSITALDQTITASDQTGAGAETLSGLIQIDAQLQPGDSGGPLVDSSGTVIGIDTAAAANGSQFDQQSSNVGFAIPIDDAMAVVRQIESGKSTATVHVGQTRALLGVGVQDSQGGALVTSVEAGSPAATAGLAAGDLITALGGTTVASQADLRTALAAHQPGDTVTVTWVDTSGNTHTATATLASGPPA